MGAGHARKIKNRRGKQDKGVSDINEFHRRKREAEEKELRKKRLRIVRERDSSESNRELPGKIKVKQRLTPKEKIKKSIPTRRKEFSRRKNREVFLEKGKQGRPTEYKVKAGVDKKEVKGAFSTDGLVKASMPSESGQNNKKIIRGKISLKETKSNGKIIDKGGRNRIEQEIDLGREAEGRRRVKKVLGEINAAREEKGTTEVKDSGNLTWEDMFRNEPAEGSVKREPKVKITLRNLPKAIWETLLGRAVIGVKKPAKNQGAKGRRSGLTIRKKVPLSRIEAASSKEDWRKIRVDRLKQLKKKVRNPLLNYGKAMSIGKSAKILEKVGAGKNAEEIRGVLDRYRTAMSKNKNRKFNINSNEEFENLFRLKPSNTVRNRAFMNENWAINELNKYLPKKNGAEVLAAHQVFWLYAPKNLSEMR